MRQACATLQTGTSILEANASYIKHACQCVLYVAQSWHKGSLPAQKHSNLEDAQACCLTFSAAKRGASLVSSRLWADERGHKNLYELLRMLLLREVVVSSFNDCQLLARQSFCKAVGICYWNCSILVAMHSQDRCLWVNLAANLCHIYCHALVKILHDDQVNLTSIKEHLTRYPASKDSEESAALMVDSLHSSCFYQNVALH